MLALSFLSAPALVPTWGTRRLHTSPYRWSPRFL